MIKMDHPIYMDNAATTWPKPPQVSEAMGRAIDEYGGNPGRGGHRLALAAGELLYNARETVADLFGCKDPFRVCFTPNITYALNLALEGLLRAGDHVLISPMEHNAVMRPLSTIQGVEWEVLPHRSDGEIHPEAIPEHLRPNTKLVIICHESNVNGVIQPLSEIGNIARNHGALLLADCAQSAGKLPIRMEEDAIDLLAFTGHKGLMGPTGTGGLILGSRVDHRALQPLVRGGTGSLSESFEQPDFLPDRYESGTPNVCGLAGLTAGIEWLKEQGPSALRLRQSKQIHRLKEGLRQDPNITLYASEEDESQGSVISFTKNHVDNGAAAVHLEERFGIMTRIGLHCAPLAHRTLATYPDGTIRLSVSPFTKDSDIEAVIQAVTEL